MLSHAKAAFSEQQPLKRSLQGSTPARQGSALPHAIMLGRTYYYRSRYAQYSSLLDHRRLGQVCSQFGLLLAGRRSRSAVVRGVLILLALGLVCGVRVVVFQRAERAQLPRRLQHRLQGADGPSL